MNMRVFLQCLIAVFILSANTTAWSEQMTLEEATAEVERLEQENIELKQQLDENELVINEYKQQMAAIEAQIAELQTGAE